MGTPICTDTNTGKSMLERTFGQFARVLVDIFLTCELKYKVLVERKGFAKFVNLDYERIPEYCNTCSMIGHNDGNCRRNMKKGIDEPGKTLNAREGNKGKEKIDNREKEPEVNIVEKEAATTGENNIEASLGENEKRVIEITATGEFHATPHNRAPHDENVFKPLQVAEKEPDDIAFIGAAGEVVPTVNEDMEVSERRKKSELDTE